MGVERKEKAGGDVRPSICPGDKFSRAWSAWDMGARESPPPSLLPQASLVKTEY